MFTGIVEEVGTVVSSKQQAFVNKLGVQTALITGDLKIGDSVSVNGVCLTVTEIADAKVYFDVMRETALVTNLSCLKIKDKVNLERALKVGDRLGGHFVTGHVDCLGILRAKAVKSNNISLTVSFPSKFMKFLVKKGSVSLNGVSLTIAEVKGNSFSVNIIPHTWKSTNLSLAKSGSKLNIEFDMLLKANN